MKQQYHLPAALAALGLVVGIIIAVRQKKTFWTGAGYALIGNLTGAAVGATVMALKK